MCLWLADDLGREEEGARSAGCFRSLPDERLGNRRVGGRHCGGGAGRARPGSGAGAALARRTKMSEPEFPDVVREMQ